MDALRFAGHGSGAYLFGVFQVSVLHNLVHLAFGVAGLVLARTVSRRSGVPDRRRRRLPGAVAVRAGGGPRHRGERPAGQRRRRLAAPRARRRHDRAGGLTGRPRRDGCPDRVGRDLASPRPRRSGLASGRPRVVGRSRPSSESRAPMSSRITCEVRTTAPVAVVRLTGALDLGTMRSVHQALTALSSTSRRRWWSTGRGDVGPAGAVRVRRDRPPGRGVAGGAGGALLPAAGRARWLAESTTCRVVPVPADCAEATRLAGATPTPRMRARLEPVAGACRRARELVDRGVRAVEPAGPVEPAALVLSELVGNVVRHARTPMQVTLTLRRPYLHLAVADGSSAQAGRGSPGLHAEGGRGLLLVRELAQRWGSRRRPGRARRSGRCCRRPERSWCSRRYWRSDRNSRSGLVTW